MPSSKRILISNGRFPTTLDFVRNLASLDHEIYLAETQKWNLSSFSNKIKKSFVVPSPRFHPHKHVESLIKIIEREKIDLFIPMWEDIFIISKNLDKFPSFCKVFSSNYELLTKMHNKWSFAKLLDDLNIPSPKCYFITDKKQFGNIDLPDYALKACYSRGSQKVYRITNESPYPNIVPSEKEPWIAQEWCEGNHFCSYSICHEGSVKAHVTYPMEFAAKKRRASDPHSGGYCVSFRSVKHDQILNWTKALVEKTHFTGQIAFDFVETASGDLLAIECNPRSTAGISLFESEDRIDQAFFGQNEEIIEPKPNRRKQITIGNLMYGWQSAIQSKKFPRYLENLFMSKDVIIHKNDLRPFFAQPILWAQQFYNIFRFKTDMASAFLHDLEYNGD